MLLQDMYFHLQIYHLIFGFNILKLINITTKIVIAFPYIVFIDFNNFSSPPTSYLSKKLATILAKNYSTYNVKHRNLSSRHKR